MKQIVKSILIACAALLWIGCPMGGPSDEGDAPGEGEAHIWYVSAAAADGGDGQSWQRAFRHPQRAVNAAGDGEVIKVSEGAYGPWPGNPDSAVIHMKPGVELYGGYRIVEGQSVGRDTLGHSSDLWGVSYGEDESDWLRSVHIVLGASNARLDGFTIVEGNTCLDAMGGDLYSGNLENPEFWGAGIWNNSVEKLRVHDCRFARNQSENCSLRRRR